MNFTSYYEFSFKREFISKLLLIMRLVTLLLIASFMQVSATSLAQKVTLNEKNISLENVFKEIRKQTGYDFVYTNPQLNLAKTVTIQVKDSDLKEALDQCFLNQPLSYSIENKTIIVTNKAVAVQSAIVQERVSGTVTDKNGTPIAGVSVKVKGKDDAVITIKTNDGREIRGSNTQVSDMQGRFSVEAKRGDVLVFSYVGKKTTEVTIGSDQTIKVQLEENVENIDDVVVVGYGTTLRKDLTGSVASVNMKEVANVPFMSFDNALVGKAAGVQVIKADGAPGGAVRIRVRGGTSLIGSNDPLYVIDGIPVTIDNKYTGVTDMTNPMENYGGENARNSSISGSFARGLNNLAGLNIDDIESIDILKDASATAIYGSKAANGVVIITTKKGKLNQKPVLEANYYAGFSQARREKVLNRDQYLMILKEAAQNRVDEDLRLSRVTDPSAQAIVNNTAKFGTADTDWLDLVLRNGLTQNANVSVRGGGIGSRYYTSLAYTEQKGVIIGTDFNRISGKISLDNEITNRFRVITNLDYGFTQNNITNGLYGNALLAPPTNSPYREDGSFTNFDDYNLGSDFGLQNPLALATATNLGKTNMLLGSLSAEYDILNDLKFKSMLSVNYSAYKQRNYIPSYLEIANPNSQGGVTSGGGVGSQAANESVNTFFENTLTWNKEFNEDNRLNLLGGTSFEKYRAEFFSAEGRGFPDDDYLNNLNSAATATQVRGSNPSGLNALLSFYLRANYAFKERYLVTFTGRADISSKFSKGNQTGYFPSGAIAWKINEENFLKNVSWIDELKIRASAGTTGTNSIADNMFRSLYTANSYAGASGLIPTQLGNDRIKWESTLQKDLGLDFALFNSRLRGAFGYYNKTTDGVLLNITTAPSYAFGSVVMNIAEIRNTGLEFDLRGDVIRSKNFTWNSALNISQNKSKVLKINGGPFSDPNNRNALNLGTSIVKEGEPLGLLYGRVATGVIKNQQELDDQKAVFPNYTVFNRWLNIGDLAYEIENGVWKQNIIGNATPDFMGGFTNSFNYKNLSLITLMTFSYGNDVLFQNDVSNRQVVNAVNKGVSILGRYNADNLESDRQRLLWGGSVFNTGQNIYDGSYLKMKSVTLAYNLPTKFLSKLNLGIGSIYMTSTNLFTITNYPGLDPEVSDAPGSIIGGGRDLSTYPTTREIIVGMRLNF